MARLKQATITAFGILLIPVYPNPGSAQLIGSGEVLEWQSPPPDHRISYGPGAQQFGNLRLPAGTSPHPIVVFIHGGCWLSTFDIQYVGQTEVAITEAGYAVWSIEYRRLGDEGGGWPSTYLDVGQGIDHLRKIAEPDGLDLSRVVVAGHSAGGALALWAAARGKVDDQSVLYTPKPLPVQAVFALAPAPDLEGLEERGSCGNAVGRLMGGTPEERPERYQAASPMQLAPISVPQTLLIGGQDLVWAPPGRSYYHRAITVGTQDVRIVDLPDSGHFEMVSPSTTTWPLVISALEEAFKSMTPLGEWDKQVR
jgi:acetyl esterase/lipase